MSRLSILGRRKFQESCLPTSKRPESSRRQRVCIISIAVACPTALRGWWWNPCYEKFTFSWQVRRCHDGMKKKKKKIWCPVLGPKIWRYGRFFLPFPYPLRLWHYFEPRFLFHLYGLLLGGVKSMQIAVLWREKFCKPPTVVEWWNFHTEQFFHQLKLSFRIVTG